MEGLGPPTQMSVLAMRSLGNSRYGTLGRSQGAIDAAAWCHEVQYEVLRTFRPPFVMDIFVTSFRRTETYSMKRGTSAH